MSFFEIKYSVRGRGIPGEHRHLLYGAIQQYIPELDELPEVTILDIEGRLADGGRLVLLDESCLVIRSRKTYVSIFMRLAGKKLRLGRRALRLGLPYVSSMDLPHHLYSPCVALDGFEEPESFLDALQGQASQLGIQTKAFFLENPQAKTIQGRGRRVSGFAVCFRDLSPDESRRLLRSGLGGNRKLGCGVFRGL